MDSISESSEDDLSPDEAFAILGNELRVEILRTLWTEERAEDGQREPTGLSFSELCERVDATNSSQFSYHLDRLDGAFVRSTDEGYRLTRAGEKVVRAILAGTYNERPDFEPVELEGLCPACQATCFEARHEDEILVVRCTDCETRLLSYALSPQQVENRTPREVVESADRYVREEFAMAIGGVCAECAGKMTSHVRPSGEPLQDRYLEVAECEGCGHRLTAPVEARLTYHPAVIAFYWERGVDVTDEPFWGTFTRLHSEEWETECLSSEPYEFRVVISLDGDELRVELDGDLEVRSVEAVEDRLPSRALES